ncbi:hypothetical protein [Pseudonocardia sp. ICBG601]|uniref:hypothetical protein n=1 Tax=Pseudonocardia sp. ICBG601 TaxID=2846759 RepID=UPI001CF6ADAB|nr:hypothetical protein [Pseudonocardia sp. ICBG601]
MRRLLVVLTLLVGTLLLGGTAWAAPGSCQIPPEPDRPGRSRRHARPDARGHGP